MVTQPPSCIYEILNFIQIRADSSANLVYICKLVSLDYQEKVLNWSRLVANLDVHKITSLIVNLASYRVSKNKHNESGK